MSETAEETGSVSEEDVSMSESSCSVTSVSIANKLRSLRESKLKAAMETTRSEGPECGGLRGS
jgi:hypothetical protein